MKTIYKAEEGKIGYLWLLMADLRVLLNNWNYTRRHAELKISRIENLRVFIKFWDLYRSHFLVSTV